MDGNSARTQRDRSITNNYFAYNGKLMLISLVVLLAICIVIGLFHSYASWLHRRRRRRPRSNRLGLHNHRAGPRAFFTDGPARKGLDRSLLKSLPTFFYAAQDPPLECAVCLSEFAENEAGRVFPRCNHRFHVDCIDMWFFSHPNCPICRAPVKAAENPGRVNGEPADLDVGSSSGLGSACERGADQISGSNSSLPTGHFRKDPELIGITVEEPSANRVS